MPRCIVHGASSPEKAQGQPHLEAGGTQRPRPQAPRPRGRPKANITQAWRLGCLATRARARPPAPAEEGPGSPSTSFFFCPPPSWMHRSSRRRRKGKLPVGRCHSRRPAGLRREGAPLAPIAAGGLLHAR